jgi:hypothetical protein
VSRWHLKRSGVDDEKIKQNGMLFAAGLITGEALVGIFIAICIWISKNPDVLGLHVALPGAQWLAAAVLVAICYMIFRAGTPRSSS